jgi:hypothetical protein
MRESTNPLDKIKIASPCSANWDEMYGSERKRFCAECKLNVYNVSEMTKDEAENFILRSEGRLCLRVFQRRDGTVITRDCPVGWARVKRRISRVYSAALSIAGGFLAGVLGLGALRALDELGQAIPPPNDGRVATTLPASNPHEVIEFMGGSSGDNINEVGLAILTSRF